MKCGNVASSSKGLKFSAIRKLPTANTGPASTDTATVAAASTAAVTSSSPAHRVRNAETSSDGPVIVDTLRRLKAQEQAAEDDDETDRRISLHRYAQLVARLNAQRSQYYSTGVFVEEMLKEAQHADGTGPATQAAIATWGLHILARESHSDALVAVIHALLPALYCNYEPGLVCTASPAVQLQVRERDAIDDNPYFTHTMFVDEAQSGKQSTLELRRALEAAVRANDERRNVVMRLVQREQRARLSVVLRSWRSHVRRDRLMQLISDNKAKRGVKETEQLCKQAVFYQWRLLVERSRSAYLTERLHDAAFQLENAKNQFQLQCYRADRLVQTAKDAANELAKVTQANADLSQEVKALKEERVQREKEFNKLLTHSVTRLLRLLGTYDDLSHIFIHSKQVALPDSAAAAFARDADSISSPSCAPGNADAKAAGSSNTTLELLRRWVNGVLANVQGRETPFRPLEALGTDFADGERYLCLLQCVFPDIVSSTMSVQTMGMETRLRRIRDCAVQCKLRYVLLPSDFLNEREDLLVCSLSELRQRHLIRLWRQSTQQSATELGQFRESTLVATVEACVDKPGDVKAMEASAGSAGEDNEEETEREGLLDSAAVTKRVADFVQRLQHTEAGLEAAVTAETEAINNCVAILAEEAHLGSERLHGAPIPVVEEASRRVFWQVAANALNDLREEPQLKTEAMMWDFTVTQSLPAVLRDHVDIIARLFFFFAGENAKALSEVAFWRFVEASGLLVSPLDVPKQWIVAQYDRVVSPQLDAALRAAARNQSEMSVAKLREVAYQEMDIRTAAPSQFVELLVRLAVASRNGEFGLVEGTRRLLQHLQVPNLEKMSVVERDLCSPETQHVLRYFNEDLFRIFLFYVKQQASSRNAQERTMALQDGGRFAAQMSLETLLSVLDDCRYLSDVDERGTAAPLAADATRPCFFVATSQIRKLVPAVEQQWKVPTSGYLSFGLFIDVLAAVAYYWCPDPFVPASRRLAAFLSFTMQQLSARHVNSTLLLGSASLISLDGAKMVDFSQEARPMSGSL